MIKILTYYQKSFTRKDRSTVVNCAWVFFIACVLNTALASLSFAEPLAGETILNQAQIEYTVGSDQASAAASNAIVVDARLNLSVASQLAAALPVIANQTDAALPFTVTNLSNSTNDILLDAKLFNADAAGNPDTYSGFADADHRVFVDVNNDGDYDPAIDTAQFINDLAPNASQTVFIVTNIPSAIVSNELAAVALIAQIADTNGNPITNDSNRNVSPAGTFENGINSSAGTPNNDTKIDNPLNVLNVFADGTGDIATDGSTDINSNGQFSDANGYVFNANPTNISKSADIIDCDTDEVVATNQGEVYAGLCLRYSLEVNAVANGSDNVTVTDNIPDGTQYVANSLLLDNTAKTDASGDDEGSVISSNSQVVFSLGTMNAGDSKIIQFKVEVL